MQNVLDLQIISLVKPPNTSFGQLVSYLLRYTAIRGKSAGDAVIAAGVIRRFINPVTPFSGLLLRHGIPLAVTFFLVYNRYSYHAASRSARVAATFASCAAFSRRPSACTTLTVTAFPACL